MYHSHNGSPPISVIAVDLDDTLLRSDKGLSAHTLEMLQAWDAAGGRIVIATGRPYRSAREIPAALHAYPLISTNGGEIWEGDQSISQDLMAVEDTRQIITQILDRAPDCWIGLESGSQLTANLPVDRPGVLVAPDLAAAVSLPTAKVIMRLSQCQPFLSTLDTLPPTCKVLVSEKYDLVQIMSRTADKAVALEQLLARWGLSMAQVAAFGDDTNDVEMVRLSGLGVAVRNAVPEVLAVADRVTGSNDEDGVAVVVAELIGRLS